MKGVCATREGRSTAIARRPLGFAGLITSALLAIGIAAFAQAPSPPKTPVPNAPPKQPAPTAPTPVAQTPVTRDADLLSLPTATPIRGMSWPALSPDAKTLCFTYLGDLWTAPAEGGTATRLTVNESLSASPHWSPDGKFIAFSSLRSGNTDIFLIPAEGGEPRQVTFNSGADWVNDWSPDGKHLLFYSIGRDTKDFALFSIDLRNRALKQISHDIEAVRFGAWSPDGKLVAYTRAGMPWWRPWYRGSVAANTVIDDTTTGKVRTVLKTSTQQFWPLFAPDGRSLYITTILGSGNTPNLYQVPLEGGTPKAITHYTTDAVRFPSISHNGAKLTYLYNGDLYTVRPDGSDAHMVRILARSDDKINNERREVLHDHADESELSPDGKTLALVLRGNIWVVPTSGGDATRLTNNTGNNNDITWSPDGTRIAFISDMGNQPDVYTIDVKSKAVARLTNDSAAESNPTWSPDGNTLSFAKAGPLPGLYVVPTNGSGPAKRLAEGNGNNQFGNGITSHGWSPDSKWVAFSRMDRYQVTDIWVVPAIGGTPVNVTAYPDVNLEPKFTHDGKYLLFISTRGGQPQLYKLPLQPPSGDSDADKKKASSTGGVKIDFTEIQDRAELMGIPGPVFDFAPTPDGQHVVAQAQGRFWGIGMDGPAFPITPGVEMGTNIDFAPNGNRFYYLGANGTPRSLGVPPGPPGPPSVVSFSADWLFDRRAMILQAFNEFYRRFGDTFYDGSLNGVDWPALRRKYEPLLQGVGTAIEFANLLSEMVGEVNSSHSEIGPAVAGFGPQTATLGLNYDYDYAGPGLKVAAVMPKGPADQPGAHVYAGDYVLSVDGTDVRLTEDYYQTLQDKSGKEVTLLVNNKPSKEGARTVKVKPIGYGEWEELDYKARIQFRKERVDKLSSGRLAYIHVQTMDEASLQKFRRDLYSEGLHREGLILDIRGNGGGNTHDQILQALSQHVVAYLQPRDALRETDPPRAFTHPVVLLIDQNAYSDAEIFPAGFRALKLGKIVGVTTPGYVIGTYEGRLVDGTTFRMPSWGYYTRDGKNMENLGIAPDITVENTPESVAAGHDRQLEVAVQTLLKELPPTPANLANDESVGVFSSANANPNGGSSAVHGGHPTKAERP
jgi:tricorn protease